VLNDKIRACASLLCITTATHFEIQINDDLVLIKKQGSHLFKFQFMVVNSSCSGNLLIIMTSAMQTKEEVEECRLEQHTVVQNSRTN